MRRSRYNPRNWDKCTLAALCGGLTAGMQFAPPSWSWVGHASASVLGAFALFARKNSLAPERTSFRESSLDTTM